MWWKQSVAVCNSSTTLSLAAMEPSLTSNLLSRSQCGKNYFFDVHYLLSTHAAPYNSTTGHSFSHSLKQSFTNIFLNILWFFVSLSLSSFCCTGIVQATTASSCIFAPTREPNTVSGTVGSTNRFFISKTRNTEAPFPEKGKYLEVVFGKIHTSNL